MPFRKYRRLASLKIIAPKTSYFRDALPLNRHLEDLGGAYPSTRNSFGIKEAESKSHHRNKTKKEHRKDALFLFGRSGGTRTRGLQYPKLARYQLRYTSKDLVF